MTKNDIKRDFCVVLACLLFLSILIQAASASDMFDPFKRMARQTITKGATALKGNARANSQIFLAPTTENQQSSSTKAGGSRNMLSRNNLTPVSANSSATKLSKFQSVMNNLVNKIGSSMRSLFGFGSTQKGRGLERIPTGIDKRLKDTEDTDVFAVFRKGQK